MLCKPILHQTTIVGRVCFLLRRCILLKFYIKPQLWRGGTARVLRCILLNFYIKPQPRRARRWRSTGCILLNFYIKPQPGVTNGGIRSVVSYWISTSNHNNDITAVDVSELYLIEFLHQTTTSVLLVWLVFCCILLNFYIKPQHIPCGNCWQCVVSYWISTSNHNRMFRRSISTLLYLIEFLHQTTTR